MQTYKNNPSKHEHTGVCPYKSNKTERKLRDGKYCTSLKPGIPKEKTQYSLSTYYSLSYNFTYKRVNFFYVEIWGNHARGYLGFICFVCVKECAFYLYVVLGSDMHTSCYGLTCVLQTFPNLFFLFFFTVLCRSVFGIEN